MNQKSKVAWIKYDIDWKRLAKRNCKMCHGRGFEGYEVLPEAEQERLKTLDKNWKPALMLCNCAVNHWMKLNDEERMKYATLKENAEELQKRAKEMVKEVVEEESKNAVE